MNIDKDVQFVVEAAVVVLVEDLQPDEHVEDHGAHFIFRVGEELGACEVKNETGNHLEDGLADDHFPHCDADDGGFAGCGWAVEDLVCGRVGRERECGEGVPGESEYGAGEIGCDVINLHEQVDPEELHCRQNGAHLRVLQSGDKCNCHSSDVDSDLKL